MDASQLIQNIKTEILNPILVLLFAIAFLYFVYGVFEAIRDARGEVGRTKGREHMFWGIIGMAIMVSAFGLVNLICNTINC